MEQITLIIYYNRICDKFKRHLSKARKSAGSDAIHNFRVAFKQLQAIGFLLSSFSEIQSNDWQKWEQRLKPVYKKGGKVRNIQVLRAHCTEYGFDQIDSLLMVALDNAEKELAQEMITFSSGFRVAASNHARKAVSKCSGKLEESPGFFNELYQSSFSVAESYLSTPPSESWHEARRLIKYCYHLSNSGITGSEIPAETRLRIRMTEQLLGIWHDMIMLEKWCTNQQMPEIVKAVQQKLHQLEKEISQFSKLRE